MPLIISVSAHNDQPDIAYSLSSIDSLHVAKAKIVMNVRSLKPAPGSAVDFGVEIDNVDLENITGEERVRNKNNMRNKYKFLPSRR